MDILFLAKTLDIVGKVLLGIMVLRVHWRVIQEHNIDKRVIKSMKREMVLGILGIVFMIAGYIIEISL